MSRRLTPTAGVRARSSSTEVALTKVSNSPALANCTTRRKENVIFKIIYRLLSFLLFYCECLLQCILITYFVRFFFVVCIIRRSREQLVKQIYYYVGNSSSRLAYSFKTCFPTIMVRQSGDRRTTKPLDYTGSCYLTSSFCALSL